MDHFTYKNGILHAEEMSVPDIAEGVGTPFYCYSSATLTRHYRVMEDAFAAIPTTICFAVKANSNVAVLKTLAQLGSGADCVSEGEIRRALAAGIPADKIVFSGVGKKTAEIAYALSEDIAQFNVESVEELHMIDAVAQSQGKKARIALRINPDIEAGTHDKISTGRKTDKFGIPWENALEAYLLAASLNGINVCAISTHIGSQLTSLNPFQEAFNRVVELVALLGENGIKIDVIDLGGGLGIPYNDEAPPPPSDYANMIVDTIKHLGCKLILEPGRLIAGNAGILVSSVILTKQTEGRNFVVADAAMNDLMRPALYDARHAVIPVVKADSEIVADIVGPVCETGDVFARNANLPKLAPHDLIAFRSAGAYGAVMSNSYNSRLLVPEVLVNEGEYAVIRPRPTYNEMLELEATPPWLENC